jgi:hypothetical protein
MIRDLVSSSVARHLMASAMMVGLAGYVNNVALKANGEACDSYCPGVCYGECDGHGGQEVCSWNEGVNPDCNCAWACSDGTFGAS